jgi:hypothetical protein
MLKYLFREIDFENMYAKNVKNEEIVNMELEGLMGYL